MTDKEVLLWRGRSESNEAGEPVNKDFDIEFDAIPTGAAYPICSSVARYYVTLLNPQQLEAFVSEWDKAATEPEYSHLKDLRLIREVAENYARDQSTFVSWGTCSRRYRAVSFRP